MRQGRPYYFFAILVLPMVIFLRNPQAVESFHNVSSVLMRPVLNAGNRMTYSVLDAGEYLQMFWNTFQKNLENEEKLQEMDARLGTYEEIKRENARLLKLLSLKATIPSKTFPARVIGWDPSWVRKAILLDKGTQQKIKKDMPVMVSEGLLGRVVETSSSTSKVFLLIDPDMRVGAMTSESRSQGIVAGDGSSKLFMHYLELDSGVAVGEEVLTSGSSGLFPKGLRIGKITSLEKTPSGLHLIATVQPDVPFSKLEEVLCLDFSRPK